ncbi:MAG TPA: nuclear transport factor 2 family protein [Thermoleophilaceae bacterium]
MKPGSLTSRSPDDEPDPLHRLVRRWARAVNERDSETVISYSHPEIDCYPLQIATVSGHYQGHDGVRRWLDDMVASDIGHQVDFVGIRTLPDGRIALFGRVCVEGKEISPYSLIATIRDDKVVGMRSYLSDEETMEHLKLLR